MWHAVRQGDQQAVARALKRRAVRWHPDKLQSEGFMGDLARRPWDSLEAVSDLLKEFTQWGPDRVRRVLFEAAEAALADAKASTAPPT